MCTLLDSPSVLKLMGPGSCPVLGSSLLEISRAYHPWPGFLIWRHFGGTHKPTDRETNNTPSMGPVRPLCLWLESLLDRKNRWTTHRACPLNVGKARMSPAIFDHFGIFRLASGAFAPRSASAHLGSSYRLSLSYVSAPILLQLPSFGPHHPQQ